MKHLAIYNLTTHEVDCIESYAGDEREDVCNLRHLYDDDGMPYEEEVKVGEIILWEAARDRLGRECINRGSLNGAWVVYNRDVPFTWELVTPKPAPPPGGE